jgi:hypothetical protein
MDFYEQIIKTVTKQHLNWVQQLLIWMWCSSTIELKEYLNRFNKKKRQWFLKLMKSIH